MTAASHQRMIRKCLADLGIDVVVSEGAEGTSDEVVYAKAMLEEAGSLDGQFALVKKIYFARILEQHPDKGGDAAAFRDTRLAFEILRDMKSNGTLKTFLVGPGDGNDDNDAAADMDDFEKYKDMYQDGATPSYEYYEAAAEVEEPGYKVELAKSGRSQCEGCKKGAKGSFRGKSHTAKPAAAKKSKKGKKKTTKKKEEEPATAAEAKPEPVAAPSANVKADPETMEETAPEPPVTSSAIVAKSEPEPTPEGVRRNPRRSTRAIVVAAAKAKSPPPPKKAKPTKSKKAKKNSTAATLAAAAEMPSKSTDIVPAAAASKSNDDDDNNTTSKAVIEHPLFIPQGAVRVGSLNQLSGGYGRWNHLPCWRVPYRVWAGLTEPTDAKQVEQDLIDMEQVLLIGVRDLPPEEMQEFVQHVMNKNHWAKKINRKKSSPPPDLKEMRRQAAEAAVVAEAAAVFDDGDQKPAVKRSADEENIAPGDAKKPKMEVGTSTALAKAIFIIPRPGMEGAQENCFAGLRFVLSGTFPQVGGGTGLSLGKEKIKGMIEDFGGKCTGSISGKTNFLVLGKDPGATKVAAARAKDVPMLDIQSLKDKIMGVLPSLEKAEAPAITSFSAGYNNKRIEY